MSESGHRRHDSGPHRERMLFRLPGAPFIPAPWPTVTESAPWAASYERLPPVTDGQARPAPGPPTSGVPVRSARSATPDPAQRRRPCPLLPVSSRPGRPRRPVGEPVARPTSLRRSSRWDCCAGSCASPCPEAPDLSAACDPLTAPPARIHPSAGPRISTPARGGHGRHTDARRSYLRICVRHMRTARAIGPAPGSGGSHQRWWTWGRIRRSYSSRAASSVASGSAGRSAAAAFVRT